MDRRRFLALGVGASVATGLVRVADAQAAVSPWRSDTWTARIGERILATDAAGRKRALRVARIVSAPQQAGTTGESFTVVFTGAGSVTSGQYRLRSRQLSATAYLGEGGHGHATLVVNSMRPAAT